MKRNRSVALTTFLLLLGAMLASSCIRKPAEEVPDSEKELDHLVILEVFYQGNYRVTYVDETKGKEYGYVDNNDQYIKIHNPTKEVKYLDGLAIALTEFSSMESFEFISRDFRNDSTAITLATYFPGSGTEYPIQPGETKIITGAAIDHTKDQGWDEDVEEFLRPANPNSYDFSKADFQWHNEVNLSATGAFGLSLNPDVPSLQMEFNDTRFNYFELHHYKGVMLIDFPKENFEQPKFSEHLLTMTYAITITDTRNTIDRNVFAIPNSAVIDCVVICPNESNAFNPVGTEVDAGFKGSSNTHNRRPDKDTPGLGKAIRRKHDGKKWVDTNNSSVDFEIVDASNKSDYSDITDAGTAV